MRPPMSQVGWASASSALTPERSVRPRKGPPEAVSTSLVTVPGRLGARSAGRARSARSRRGSGARRSPRPAPSPARRRSPATPCWRARRRCPRSARRSSGPSPAAPTIAFRTRSASDSAIELADPLLAREHASAPLLRRRARRRPRRRGRRRGRRAAWPAPAAASQLEPAESPTTWSCPCEASITSSAWVPIEPVEPSIRTFCHAAAQCRDGSQRPLMARLSRSARVQRLRHRVPRCGSRTAKSSMPNRPSSSGRSRRTPTAAPEGLLAERLAQPRPDDGLGRAGIDQVVLRLRDRAFVDLVLDLVDADDDERRAATRGTAARPRRPRRWRPRIAHGLVGLGSGAGIGLPLARALRGVGGPTRIVQAEPSHQRARAVPSGSG